MTMKHYGNVKVYLNCYKGINYRIEFSKGDATELIAVALLQFNLLGL